MDTLFQITHTSFDIEVSLTHIQPRIYSDHFGFAYEIWVSHFKQVWL